MRQRPLLQALARTSRPAADPAAAAPRRPQPASGAPEVGGRDGDERGVRPRLREQVGLAVVAAFALAISEGLFFATKLSFLSRFPPLEQTAIALGAGLLLATLAALAQLIASVAGRFTRNVAADVVAALPAGLTLGALAFLLVDNFSYVVLDLGTLRAGAVGRAVYAALFLVVLVLCTRWVMQRAPARGRRGAAPATAGALVLAGSVAVGAMSTAGGAMAPAADTPSRVAGALPNILLLASDGVSANHTSLYGYRRDTTPFLRHLARQSVLFENAYPNVGRTYGSLLSMLSGTPAAASKAAFPPNALLGPEAFDHLPRLLRETGYTTIQVTMRYYADAADAGMRLAFDVANGRTLRHVDDEALRAANAYALLPSWYLVERILERLGDRLQHVFGVRDMENEYEFVVDAARSPYLSDRVRVAQALAAIRDAPQPWFLHVHLMDTHCCGFPGLPRSAERQQVVDAYDRAVATADVYFARIVAELAQRELLDRTLIVVSSDHGIGWDTRSRVPLMVRFPGGKPTGRRLENVQLLDVAPTVLQFLGLPKAPWMTGDSLLARLPPGRPIVSFNRVDIAPVAANPFLKELGRPGPPYYGSTSAVLLVCDRWFEVELESGQLTAGELPPSSAPCRPPGPEEARQQLRAYLERYGYGTWD